MKSITVFCGSSMGRGSEFKSGAYKLGQTIASNEMSLIYGGAKVGLMGIVADGALAQNGRVIGILPAFLNKIELAHEGLTELIVVETMHERKTQMCDLCEGVIALPGGFGTVEELFEILTWGQLGIHRKPIGLLNINCYYNSLLTFIAEMTDKGFLKKRNQDMLLVSNDPVDLIEQMKNYEAPYVEKWI